MDFHSKKNRITYTTRTADNSWIQAIKDLVPIDNISNALDVGCGGGIYSKALSDMGVGSVTGVDFSEAMLEGAIENCKGYSNISFKQGNALHTNLKGNSFNLLLERALIHHIGDLKNCFNEAFRMLKENGFYIVQDRTPEDCLIKGNDSHIRGYLFELFPRLIEKEIKRRYENRFVIDTLKQVGFKEIEKIKLWETRRVYANKEELLEDLSERKGRSILYELNNKELDLLIKHVDKSISIDKNIVEKDRWTIWKAVKM